MMDDLCIDKLSLDLARQMLIHECNLRKSAFVQNMYTLIQTGQVVDLELIENYVQYATIAFFGFNTSKNSLKNYRMINYKFGSHVVDYAFYLKYNIMKNMLTPGTVVNTSGIKLINYDDKSVSNFENVCQNKQSLIFSGSIT